MSSRWAFISSIWALVILFRPTSCSASARAIQSLRQVVWRFLSEKRQAISGLAYLSTNGFWYVSCFSGKEFISYKLYGCHHLWGFSDRCSGRACSAKFVSSKLDHYKTIRDSVFRRSKRRHHILSPYCNIMVTCKLSGCSL